MDYLVLDTNILLLDAYNVINIAKAHYSTNNCLTGNCSR